MTFFDLFHTKKLDDALDIIAKIKIIPLAQSEIDSMVNTEYLGTSEQRTGAKYFLITKIFAIDSSQNTGSPIIIGDLDVIGRCDYSLSGNSCS